jgi:ubiquinone/menaquinone biosynthesis C-methylase UbiE
MRTLHPASYIGLDLNSIGIKFCRNRHKLAGLEFTQGNAEDLPFADLTFDAVINVESSHLYPRFSRFLAEVERVMRPGGHFLYTDARTSYDIAPWDEELANAPMRMVSERAINAEVMRGMEKNLAGWQQVIDRVAPLFLRGMVRKFAPAQRAYENLRSGGPTEYRMYCFTKA